jgi:hypothetical protein
MRRVSCASRILRCIEGVARLSVPGEGKLRNEAIGVKRQGWAQDAICPYVRGGEEGFTIPQAPSGMRWPQQAVVSFGIASLKGSLATRPTQSYVTARDRFFCASASHAAAETSAAGANPYPFPDKPRPTPHEIFHLPCSATAKDIKLRCTLS